MNDCSLIIGNQLKTPSTTCRKQNKIDSTNASDGRKTPKMVNVCTINVPTVIKDTINDKLTTDGNTNVNESVTSTIKELNDFVRHSGLSRYTLTNISSRLEREY